MNQKENEASVISFEKAWLYDCCSEIPSEQCSGLFSTFEISGSKRKRQLVEAICKSNTSSFCGTKSPYPEVMATFLLVTAHALFSHF